MYYVVENGDTLYGISRQYGISVDELMKANNLSNTNIIVGSKLFIPRDDLISYKVVKGDTLWSIAKKFGVSVDLIKQFNNLKNNTINIGSILYIPSENNDNNNNNNDNSNYYIVKEGDTFFMGDNIKK